MTWKRLLPFALLMALFFVAPSSAPAGEEPGEPVETAEESLSAALPDIEPWFPPVMEWDADEATLVPMRMPFTVERLLTGHLAGIQSRWSPLGRAGPEGVIQMRGFAERKNQILVNGRPMKGASL